ncbi:MAG: KH domain-containing protein [Cyanobacteria bacterium SZAS LIN-3]|nr:KH domain-containing protein [Cyanobacteria bacterium SZAS LIN-3]MBS2008073.1 KH domain-containing protein [Cyanobacteria bacterium SZAS TMP-1]
MEEKRGPNKRYGGKPFKKTGGGGGGRRFGGRPRPVSDSTAPEDLAEYILKVLARDPDALQFERLNIGHGRCRVGVTCDPTVTGRLIGKDGRTITALRSLIRAAASRVGKRVDIEIA